MTRELTPAAQAALSGSVFDYVQSLPTDAEIRAAERERCAQIVEQSAGFPTHKLRRQVAAAIRDPNTFYEPR